MVKTRKIKSADWDKVEKFVMAVHDDRAGSTFRKEHERIWKEVDRQVRMQPMKRVTVDGKQENKPSWHSAIELGELAKASEIITADVMRLTFPQDRTWFQPHTQIEWPLGQDGKPQVEPQKQEIQDGLLRSFMSQQHKDFGLKARFRLSVKESLHHGSFAAEVRFEKQMMVRPGGKVRAVGAPVWVPYSMWNTFPDPSPAVLGTNMFYTGAMVLVEYLSLAKLKQRTGEGWMKDRLKLVEKKDSATNDDPGKDEVTLIKYKGDIVMERGDGDIFLPNSEVILANGKLVYYRESELPYPNVIFSGYERQDVRDPYYTSPIIKQSPTHRLTTIMANKFVDATGLKVEPPIEYDANDPDYVMNDGPTIAPGAKTPTRSMGKGFTSLDIGDPRFALDAMTMGMRQMQEGLGVSSLRAGVRENDRETATSATLASQGAEVRTMEFISQLEPQGLLPFLYMQHEYNRAQLEDYTFYNDEMNTQDFITISRKNVQEDVHFDVVGSRGVLGEEKRDRKIAETTAFFSGNPLFAPKLAVEPIMLEMYRDAGKKNPEQWVKQGEQQAPELPPELMQKVQELEQTAQKLAEENAALKTKERIEMQKLEADMKKFQAETQQEREQFMQTMAQERQQFAAEMEMRRRELAAEIAQDRAAQMADREKTIINVAQSAEENGMKQLAESQAQKIDQLTEMIEGMREAGKKRKFKAKRTPDGFEIDDMKIVRTPDGFEIH